MVSVKAALTNLSAPIPWHRKLWLLFRNNYLKAHHGTTCCGPPGEPGC